MTTAGGGFILFWLGVLVVWFLGLAAFEIWFKRKEGFWDWWYTEIDRRPNAGHWYYRDKKRRLSRLRG